MRIIVAGSRGFIGNAILLRILKDTSITHVYAINRSSTPSDSSSDPSSPTTSAPVARPHSKVTEIALSDEEFASWPQELIDQLTKVGVKACIWCVGGLPGAFPDLTAAYHANVELALAAAQALSRISLFANGRMFSGAKKEKPFRFVYLSVAGAERDPNARLWTQAQLRKMKGAAELALFDFQQTFEAENGAGPLEMFALRLGKVLAGGKTTANIVTEAAITSINVEKVAKVCCDIATDGWYGEDGRKQIGGVVENKDVLGPDWADIDKYPIPL